MRKTALVAVSICGSVCGSLWVAACGASTAQVTIDEAVAGISADQIRGHVGVLAHDSMRGRDTDDIGFERARDYVAREFQRLGLEPGLGDSYLQPIDLLEVVSDNGSAITVGDVALTHPDVIVAPDWMGDAPSTSGPGVFLGHDLLTGNDPVGDSLAGRVAFILAGAPEGRAEEAEIATRERAHVELALRVGAAAVVVLNPNTSEAGWAARVNARRPTRALADGSTPSPRPHGSIGPAASRRLLALWRTEPPGRATIARAHEIRTLGSWNVIGVQPGSDAARSGEAIVFTAHLDHVGIGPADAQGDSIYNGAHDNALGVAKVLAVAEAFSRLPVDRSIVYLATGAEESGLLGAWHYVNHPVVPLPQTVAAINHDGGLVNGRTDDVFTWGPEFSTLEEDVAWAASEAGMELSTDKTSPFGPSAGLLYRSDHYPFLISGVPVAYLMPGFTVDGDSERGRRAWQEYLRTVHHAQADNFDGSASYDSPVALTGLSVRLAWRLANAPEMPQTHEDAPISGIRRTPSGFFYGDTGAGSRDP